MDVSTIKMREEDDVYDILSIVENAVTVVTAIALSVLSRRPFLDRVRTLAVRTRYLIWPLLLTEISRQSSLSGRKTSSTLFLLTVLKPAMNSTHKVCTATDERQLFYV